jgi:hypothetical protein
VSGVHSLGLMTTVLPIASAGATFPPDTRGRRNGRGVVRTYEVRVGRRRGDGGGNEAPSRVFFVVGWLVGRATAVRDERRCDQVRRAVRRTTHSARARDERSHVIVTRRWRV